MRQPSTTEGKRRSDDRADPNSKAKTSIEKHHLPPRLISSTQIATAYGSFSSHDSHVAE